MGKRGRHLKAVKDLGPQELLAVANAGPAGECKHCHGRRVVKDRRGRLCICVPCFLPKPISRSAGR